MSAMGLVTTLPSATQQASLSLDFVNQQYVVNGVNKTFNELITFTRASSGGRWNSKGVYELLPADQPRLDYDPITKICRGILIEDARTNLHPYSEDFLDATWGKANGSVTRRYDMTSPVGAVHKHIEDTVAGAVHFLQRNITPVAGFNYSASRVVKAGERFLVRAQLVQPGTVVVASAEWNLTTGTVTNLTGSSSITPLGDGWYLCTMTGVATTTAVITDRWYPIVGTTGGYTGDGVSGYYVASAQLEQGGFPTSYIPTPTSFVSRSSIGSYFDSKGIMQYAPANVARFDYDPFTKKSNGMLVETAITNLAVNTNTANIFASVTRASLIDTGQQFVDDATPMRLLREDTTASNSHFAVPTVSAIAINTVYTASYYVKAGGRTKFALGAQNTGSWVGGNPIVAFDLVAMIASGTGGATGTITQISSDIFRVTWTATSGGTAFSSAVYPILRDNANVQSYTGDGVSGIYIGGYQLETGSVSSYVPSSESFTSRASTATYVDSTGTIVRANVNEGRTSAYRYDKAGNLKRIGFLTEPAATNLFLRSADLDNTSPWIRNTANITVTPNTDVAPDGTLTANLLADTGNGDDFVFHTNITLANPTATHCSSFYIKKTVGLVSRVGIFSYQSGGTTPASTVGTLDTNTGNFWESVLNTVQVYDAGTYWRIAVLSPDNGTGNNVLQVRIYPAFNLISDGATTRRNELTGSCTVWGAQLEVGTYPTSYIPTPSVFTSRASTATYLDASGLVKTAGVNVARSNTYSYDANNVLRPVGLLIERTAATNICRYSNDYSNANWTKGAGITVSTDGGLAPDGSIAQKISLSGAVSHDMSIGINALVAGTTYTLSLWMKALGAVVPSFQMAYYDAGVTVVAGSIGTPVQVVGQWKRYSTTFVCPATTVAAPRVRLIGYSGGLDGSSFYLWNCQLEVGTYPTSDIITTSAEVTRAADVSSSVAVTRAVDVYTTSAVTRAADITTSSTVVRAADVPVVPVLTPWYNDTEGTLMAEFQSVVGNIAGTFRRPVALGGSPSGEISLYLNGTSGNAAGYIHNGTVVQMDSATGAGVYVKDEIRISAISYKTNDSVFATKGVVSGADTACLLPPVAYLAVGGVATGGVNRWNGYVRSINYFPRRINSPLMQVITS